MRNKLIILFISAIILAVIGGSVIMFSNSEEPSNLNPTDVYLTNSPEKTDFQESQLKAESPTSDKNAEDNVLKFDLTNYQWGIENFPSDKNVGYVDNANTAIEKAKELWIEKYSMFGGQPYNPLDGVKIIVSYDYERDVWLINGTLPPDIDGVVPQALIQKDGKVLAVWMG